MIMALAEHLPICFLIHVKWLVDALNAVEIFQMEPIQMRNDLSLGADNVGIRIFKTW
jgi:hypothetical protein